MVDTSDRFRQSLQSVLPVADVRNWLRAWRDPRRHPSRPEAKPNLADPAQIPRNGRQVYHLRALRREVHEVWPSPLAQLAAVNEPARPRTCGPTPPENGSRSASTAQVLASSPRSSHAMRMPPELDPTVERERGFYNCEAAGCENQSQIRLLALENHAGAAGISDNVAVRLDWL